MFLEKPINAKSILRTVPPHTGAQKRDEKPVFKFPDISFERLRVYRNRGPALVPRKSRLEYVYWDRFSNVLSGGG